MVELPQPVYSQEQCPGSRRIFSIVDLSAKESCGDVMQQHSEAYQQSRHRQLQNVQKQIKLPEQVPVNFSKFRLPGLPPPPLVGDGVGRIARLRSANPWGVGAGACSGQGPQWGRMP